MASSRGSSKMVNLVNYRLRVTVSDSRQLVGQMVAFDQHMNMVLADCEEYRRIQRKSGAGKQDVEVKRSLGLVVLRGEFIVSLSVEGPPPADPSQRLGGLKSGPGVGRPAGRGIPVGQPRIAPGLAGPVRGVGGPAGFPTPPAGFRPPY